MIRLPAVARCGSPAIDRRPGRRFVSGCDRRGPLAISAPPLLRVGVVLPLSGMPAELAGQERLGIQLAADLVNADGGVQGRQLVARRARSLGQQPGAAVVAQLKAEGASVVVGSYASDLSMAVSSAAANAGLVYWESGAVADQLTGRGLPLVFRVGADGARLGANSATFAATELAPLLGKTASTLRVTIVAATDDYARSVADAAQAGIAPRARAGRPDRLFAVAAGLAVGADSKLVASRPDVVILAAHIPDGEAFRRAMIAANVHVGALIGSTMAQCVGDFGEELGADAIGVFASDRPTGGLQPGSSPAGRTNTLRPLRSGVGQGERLGPAVRGRPGRIHSRVGALPRRSAATPPPSIRRRSRPPRARSTCRRAASPTARACGSRATLPGSARTSWRRRCLAMATARAGRDCVRGHHHTAERDSVAQSVRKRAHRSVARSAAEMNATAVLGGLRPSVPRAGALAAGVAAGGVLVVVSLAARWPVPPLVLGHAAPFVPWIAITTLVATGEELVLRGALWHWVGAAGGDAAALLITSLLFALIHVPVYGWHVVPLDFGVGLMFGGLRLWFGGPAAPAAAHVLADLATWWL
jgi:ABC-type branched-subunit amino acid transport system substrate-binding protein